MWDDEVNEESKKDGMYVVKEEGVEEGKEDGVYGEATSEDKGDGDDEKGAGDDTVKSFVVGKIWSAGLFVHK